MLMLAWVVGGLLLGSLIDGSAGAWFGAALGAIAGYGMANARRIDQLTAAQSAINKGLKERVARLEAQLDNTAGTSPTETTDPSPAAQSTSPSARDADAEEQASQTWLYSSPPAQAIPASPPEPAAQATDEAALASHREEHVGQAWLDASASTQDTPAGPPQTPVRPGIIDHVIEFFTRGNPVVRVGMLVMFFGVAFLLKYAAERNVLPIELRLSAVALGALALLVLGWRLRLRPGHYGLVLQGGAIGVLYLTVYAAARLYDLMPAPLAFFMMLALVALSSLLAVLQDARPLAMFGATGGFLAPLLTSTGGGSHVMLFSYYALLNAGIFGIAWFKSWRILNLLGFGFTFIIGAAWGYQFYQPAYFSSTQPFLIVFFLFYLAIAVLFAYRQTPELKGYVDGSLVFGVPIVGFTLQYGLVKDMIFGLAFSALALSACYLVLATTLWRRSAPGMRLLTEAFLALGVVFGSLAIPLALDGRWTAAAWSLEGAAMLWVGLRQNRCLARAFAVLLQVGAGIAFLADIGAPSNAIPVINGVFLGCVIISVAGLFSAWYMERKADLTRTWEKAWPTLFIGWGLVWWFGAGFREVVRHLPSEDELHAAALFCAGTAVLLCHLIGAINWRGMRRPLIGYLPLVSLLLLVMFADNLVRHPFAGWGSIAWLAAVATHFHLLSRLETHWPPPLIQLWHAAGLWLILALLTWEAIWWTGRWIPESNTWLLLSWLLIPGLVTLALLKWGTRAVWPVAAHRNAYLGIGLAPLAAFVFLWSIHAAFDPGKPDPLGYLPILNPLDLGQLFALLVVLKWLTWLRTADLPQAYQPPVVAIYITLAIGAFAWLNAGIARAVHYWGNVAYNWHGLSHSILFQTSVSILWTLTALLVMTLATRRSSRQLWYAGAALLTIVVIKMFAVDLDGIGTVARIVSFLAVGALMLVIGYFSPLPPRRREQQTT